MTNLTKTMASAADRGAEKIERGVEKIEAELEPGLSAIAKDVAALKRDIATLMQHATKTAVSGSSAKIRSAVDQLGDETRQLYDNLAEQGQDALSAVERQVEERPVMSLLVAFALGYLGGRFISR